MKTLEAPSVKIFLLMCSQTTSIFLTSRSRNKIYVNKAVTLKMKKKKWDLPNPVNSADALQIATTSSNLEVTLSHTPHFDWKIININYCLSFLCAQHWFNNAMRYSMLATISAVTICHCYNINDYIPYVVLFISATYTFYNWKFMAF